MSLILNYCCHYSLEISISTYLCVHNNIVRVFSIKAPFLPLSGSSLWRTCNMLNKVPWLYLHLDQWTNSHKISTMWIWVFICFNLVQYSNKQHPPPEKINNKCEDYIFVNGLITKMTEEKSIRKKQNKMWSIDRCGLSKVFINLLMTETYSHFRGGPPASIAADLGHVWEMDQT